MPELARPARVAASAGLLALALTLSACGTPTATGPATPEPSATTPAATATPTASATPTPTPRPTVPAQSNLDSVTVTGEFAEDVEVDLGIEPFGIDETRSRVVIAGEGNVVPADGMITVQYHGVNGRSGEVFDSSFDDGQDATFTLVGVIPGFAKGLTGKRVGDRVLVAMPGPDGYDEAAATGQGPAGIEVGDTLLFVVDILETSVDGPSGTPVTPASGLPTVRDADGKPEVTITTSATPPDKLVVQPLVRGRGREVEASDEIMAHYRTWSWKTGKMIEDYYAAPQNGALEDTIPAWKNGLVGQRIGSRVMLVAPPAESFPEGNDNPVVEKGDTLVYVVDILFAAPPA